MELGRFEIDVVSDGDFRLDGGGMFGVVPKTLWHKVKPADELNRIRMATNSLLVRDGRHVLLVDTGNGDKLDDKFRAIYDIRVDVPRLPDRLHDLGVALEDITHVVLTHLHFDHSGWNTRRDADGRLVPTFPNARYWICRGEVEHGRAPSERDRASYLAENWEPLFEAGVVELFDDEAEVIHGVSVHKAPGHNADMCIVTLDGGGGAKAAFWADLIPHAVHTPYPWIMGFDLYPLLTLESKKRWVPRAAAEGWLGIFEHDADTPLARIVEDKPGRYRAVPVELP